MGVAQNSLLSERLAILATTTPAPTTGGGGTVTSSYVNTVLSTNGSGEMFSRMLALATVQTDGTSIATVSVLKASDASGSGAAAIATQTVASTASKVVIFDINPFTQALSDTSKTYLAVKVAATTGATGNAGLIIGGDGRYDPASYWNASGVVLSTNSV